MKKKRRYFSVVAVILLLANNTSGAAQVIAEELSKNNSNVEKIESSSEEQPSQSSSSEETEETANSSDEPGSTPSSEEQITTENSSEKSDSQSVIQEEDKTVNIEDAKEDTQPRTTEEADTSNTHPVIETRGNMTVSVSGNVFTFTLNNTDMDDVKNYMIEHDGQVNKETEIVLNGSLSNKPALFGAKEKGLRKYVKKISGNIEYLPERAFLGFNRGIQGKLGPSDHGSLTIDLPNLKYIDEGALVGVNFLDDDNIYMPALEEVADYSFANYYTISEENSDFKSYSTSLPNKLTFPKLHTIGSMAFNGYGFTHLHELDLPELINVGRGAFSVNDNLKKINAPKLAKLTGFVDKGLPSGDEFASTGISNVVFEDLNELSTYMFSAARNLKKVTVPNVSIIGAQVFKGQTGYWSQVHVVKFNKPNFESINSKAFNGSTLLGVLYNGTEHNKTIFDSVDTTNRDGKRINFYGYKENIPDYQVKKGEDISIPIVSMPKQDANAAEDSFETQVWKDGNFVSNLKLENGELKFKDFKPEDAGEYEVKVQITSSETGVSESHLTNKFKVEAKAEQLLWGTSPWSFDQNSGTLTVDPGQLATYNEKDNAAPWRRTDGEKIDADKIKKIKFSGDTKSPESSMNLFSGLANLESFEGIDKLNTSETTDMYGMFTGLKSLESLDLSAFKTSKVTNMTNMFSGDGNLTSLNLGDFKTQNVRSMMGTFEGTKSLKNLDLSGWDTSSVTTMAAIFKDSGIESLNLSSFDTSKVVNMGDSFNNLPLKKLTLGDNFKFKSNASLGTPLSQNAKDKLTGNWIREDGKSKGYSLEEFMKNYSQGDLTAGTYIAETQLLWGTSPWSFDQDSGTLTVEPGQLAEYNSEEDAAPWKRNDGRGIDADSIKKIVFTGDTVAPKDARYLFSLHNLTKIDGLEKINTAQTTDFGYMFQGTVQLEELNLSSWDTSKVTSFYCMFENAEKLNKLDVSTWKTKQVTSMSFMFKNVKNLKELNLSSWETFEEVPGVNYLGMSEMFKGTSLQKLTLGDHFKFRGIEAQLGAPAGLSDTDKLTGNWIREDGKSKAYTPDKFMENFGQDDLKAGTYVADKKEELLWGTSPWSFDEDSGTLTVEPGELAAKNAGKNSAPWRRKDDKVISEDKIKKIVFTGDTVAPKDSTGLFSWLKNLESIDGLIDLKTKNVTNMSGMFAQDQSLKDLNLSNFDTSNVTDMSNMFRDLDEIKTIDVRSFDTSNVTDMSWMFGSSVETKVENILMSKTFITSKVTNMSYMFYWNVSLKNIDVSNFDTSSVKNMEDMFAMMTGLEKIDVSQFDTSKVTNMHGMFMGLYVAEEIKMSEKFVTSEVTDMTAMFSGDKQLSELDVYHFDTSKVESMEAMFSEVGASQLDVSKFKTNLVTKMDRMFEGMANIKELNISNFNTDKLTEARFMFRDMKSLEHLNMESFDSTKEEYASIGMFLNNSLLSLTLGDNFKFHGDENLDKPRAVTPSAEVTGNWIRKDGKSKGYSPADFMTYYGKNDELTAGTYVAEGDKVNEQLLWGTAPWSFDEESGTLTVDSGDLSANNAKENQAPWNRTDDKVISKDKIKKIVFTGKNTAPVDSSGLFKSLEELVSFEGLQNLDTSKVTKMNHMFNSATKLKELDVSKWDTSKVTTMQTMFAGAESLEKIDFREWDTSSVTHMGAMFNATQSLKDIDVSEWNTSNVTNMAGTFSFSSSLETLDISKWNTSKVTNMSTMFVYTQSLTTVDVSNWDTSNVTTMSSMFYGDYRLESLDTSNWNTSNVTDMRAMFSGVNNLSSLTLGVNFRFKTDAGLERPGVNGQPEKFTGNWIRKDGKSKGYSPADFMANYGIAEDLTAGTYVAEKKLLWGTAPWTFDKETGTLTVESGELADKYATENPFPWKRTDDNKLLKEEIKKIEFKGKVIAPINSETLLANMQNLEEFDLENLDTSNVEIMTNMFALSKSITHLDLSHFKTDKVRYMDSMFADMPALTQLDLSSFETPNLTNTGAMFRNDTSLKNINLSSFDTSKVGLMYSMFLNNSSLTELDLSNFEIRRDGTVSMSDMFKGVTSLSKLKLGEGFSFGRTSDPHLEAPVALNSDDEVNGKWVREDGRSRGFTPKNFMEFYYYGTGNELKAGTYVAQTSRFGFKEVPEKMSFKKTKISNRTTLTQRQDPQWKMTVEDTRPTSSNWHVTAKMEENFKDSKGNPVDSDLLLFRKNGQTDQWINSKSETIVYEGKGNPVKDDHDISWDEKEGPLIQVAPGAVKADGYKGDITWNLVDAPL